MTRQYEITFQMDREDAENRASNGNGEVTDDGNYRRETTLTAIAEIAEEDPDATVRAVA